MDKGTTNATQIKHINRQLIYNYLRRADSATKQDIVYVLHLSLPTVTQNLQFLEERGLITASSPVKNTGGRNAGSYKYVPRAKIAVGVDISRNHIRAAAVDLLGNVINVDKWHVRFSMDDSYFQKIGAIVEEIIKDSAVFDEQILGVGIAVPGLVSKDGSHVTYGLTMNFTGATLEEFTRYIPYKARLLHDAHAAGYGELRADDRADDAFYLNICNTIGGCVLINGQVYMGEKDKAGEIGHLTLHPNERRCYCGKTGCFEMFCNAEVLSIHTRGNLGLFFDGLEEHDTKLTAVWKDYVENLSLAIHNIRMLFDSPIIVGGYVGEYIEKYMDTLYENIDERDPFNENAADYVFPCKYKVEAIAAGAAMMYVDEFIESV